MKDTLADVMEELNAFVARLRASPAVTPDELEHLGMPSSPDRGWG